MTGINKIGTCQSMSFTDIVPVYLFYLCQPGLSLPSFLYLPVPKWLPWSQGWNYWLSLFTSIACHTDRGLQNLTLAHSTVINKTTCIWLFTLLYFKGLRNLHWSSQDQIYDTFKDTCYTWGQISVKFVNTRHIINLNVPFYTSGISTN